MRVLRIALLSALGLIAVTIHDLSAAIIELIMKPTSYLMLSFRLFLWYASCGFILTLPICIGLGELWFKDIRRYIPHVLLLIALSIWAVRLWSEHPNRILLFLACAFLTLPLRWLIDRVIVPKAVG